MSEIDSISAEFKQSTASSWKKRLSPQSWGKLVQNVFQQHQNIDKIHLQFLLCKTLLEQSFGVDLPLHIVEQVRRGVDATSISTDDINSRQRRIGKIVSPLIHKYFYFAVSTSIIHIKTFYSLMVVSLKYFGFGVKSENMEENGMDEDKNTIYLLSNFVPLLLREIVALIHHLDNNTSKHLSEQIKEFKRKESLSYFHILLDLISLFLNYIENYLLFRNNSISSSSSSTNNIETCNSTLSSLLLNKNIIYFISYSLYLLQNSSVYGNIFQSNEITMGLHSWKVIQEIVNNSNSNSNSTNLKTNENNKKKTKIVKKAMIIIEYSVSLFSVLIQDSPEERENNGNEMEMESKEDEKGKQSNSELENSNRRNKIVRQIIEIYSESQWNKISSTIEKSHVQNIMNSNSDNQYYTSISIGFLIEEECISKKVNRRLDESASQFLRIANINLLTISKLYSDLWISAWRSLFYYYTLCYQISASSSVVNTSVDSDANPSIGNNSTTYSVLNLSTSSSTTSNPLFTNALRSYMLRKAYLFGKIPAMIEILIGISDSVDEEKKRIEESIIQFANYSSFSLLSSTPTSALTSSIQHDAQTLKDSVLLSIISICDKKGLIDIKRLKSLFSSTSSLSSNLLSDDSNNDPSVHLNMELQIACEDIKNMEKSKTLNKSAEQLSSLISAACMLLSSTPHLFHPQSPESLPVSHLQLIHFLLMILDPLTSKSPTTLVAFVMSFFSITTSIGHNIHASSTISQSIQQSPFSLYGSSVNTMSGIQSSVNTMSGIHSSISGSISNYSQNTNTGNNIIEIINLYGKIPDLISIISYYLDSWGNTPGANTPSDMNEGSPEYMLYKYFGNTLLLLVSLLEHYDPKYPNNLSILKEAIAKYPIYNMMDQLVNNRSVWFIRWYYQLLHNHFSISSSSSSSDSSFSTEYQSILSIGRDAGRDLIKLLFRDNSDILELPLALDFNIEHNSILDKDIAIKNLLSQYSPWQLMDGIHYLIDQMIALLQYSSKTNNKKGVKIDSKKIVEIIETITRHIPFSLLFFLVKFSLSLDFLLSSFTHVTNSSFSTTTTTSNTSSSNTTIPPSFISTENEKEKIWMLEQWVDIFNLLIVSSTSNSNVNNSQSYHNSSNFTFATSTTASQTIEESVISLLSGRLHTLVLNCISVVNNKSISLSGSAVSQILAKLEFIGSILMRYSPYFSTSNNNNNSIITSSSSSNSNSNSNSNSSIPSNPNNVNITTTMNVNNATSSNTPTLPVSNTGSLTTSGGNVGILTGINSGTGGSGGGGFMNSVVHKHFTNIIRDSLNGGIKEKEIENSLISFYSLSLSAGVHKLVSLITKEVLASIPSPNFTVSSIISNNTQDSILSNRNSFHNEHSAIVLTKQSLRAAEIGGCIIGSCGLAVVSHYVSNILPMYIPHLVSPNTHTTTHHHHYGVAHSQLLAYLSIVALTTARIDLFPVKCKWDKLRQQESQSDSKARRKLKDSMLQLVSNLLLPSTSFPACSPSFSFPLAFLSLASNVINNET